MSKIAIIGISLLFPKSKNKEEYFKNLLEGKDLKSSLTEDKLLVSPQIFFNENKNQVDRFYCNKGGFLYDLQIDFNKELSNLDNLFKWSFYTAKESLNDSGYLKNKNALNSCGIVLANLSFPNTYSNYLFLPIYQKFLEDYIQKITGNKNFVLPYFTKHKKEVSKENAKISGGPALLISNLLKLGGSSYSIDAACSSSLYAIKLASLNLISKKANLMIASSISAADPFFLHIGFSIFQAYPQNNLSFPLDKKTFGLMSGEGTGSLVLKRLEDAIKDGDKIYGVIDSIGLSNDGSGSSVLSPNPKGQIKAFERAYENSKVKKEEIQYLECHSTGTPLGDKIELESIQQFFDNTPYLSSVKSNLGHLLTSAGMASVIKVLLSMENSIIPATINIKEPLDKKVLTKNLKWQDEDKIAGVNAFGFGGTNAHIILEKRKNYKIVKSHFKKSENYFIKGIDAFFGNADNIYKFNDLIQKNKNNFIDLPKNRWEGFDKNENCLNEFGIKKDKAGFIEKLDFDFQYFKIPPNQDDRLIFQQLLMLKVGNNALIDANIQKGTNTAVIIAMGSDLTLHRYRGRVNLEAQLLNSTIDKSLIPKIKDAFLKPAKTNQYTSYIGNIMASRIASLWDFSGPAFTISSEDLSSYNAIEVGMLLIDEGLENVLIGAVDIACSYENFFIHSNKKIKFGEGAGAIVLSRNAKDYYSKIKKLEFKKEKENLNFDSVEKNIGHTFAASGIAEIIKASLLKKNIRISGTYDEISAFIDLEAGSKEISQKEEFKSHFSQTIYLGEKNIEDELTKVFKSDFHSQDVNSTSNSFPSSSLGMHIFKYFKSGLHSYAYAWERVEDSVGLCHSRLRGNDTTEIVQKPNYVTVAEKGRGVVFLPEANLQQALTDYSLVHLEFLQSRNLGLMQLKELIDLNLPKPNKTKDIIWDKKALLEFAEGKIANVFGDAYKEIDNYKVRVRLPLKDYFFVSRVSKLTAKINEFKPSSIRTEYDIPHNEDYLIDGQIPWAVAVEAGQCDLLLISYLGIDFYNKGEKVYRLLDCTLTFFDKIAMAGDTLIYDIKINNFAKNGESLLFFFSYDCFVKDKLVLTMRNGCAGFFTQKELKEGKGLIYSKEEINERQNIKKSNPFKPLLNCPKKSFNYQDLIYLCEGNLEKCFGENYTENKNPSLKFSSKKMLMISRIVDLDIKGGAYGLGTIYAEKDLKPDDWYFPCHFKDDPVLAGSLMSEACVQVLEFYMLYLGLHKNLKNARFQPVINLPQKVRCRGQVIPSDKLLKYKMEVKEINIQAEPYVIADVEVLLGDKIIVDFKDLGVRLNSPEILSRSQAPAWEQVEVEKNFPLIKGARGLSYTKSQLQEFATGSLVKCFGEEFQMYENKKIAPRTPNSYLQLIDKITLINGEKHNFKNPAFMKSEIDIKENDWFIKDGIVPYSILMEIALQPCGFLSTHLGTTLIYKDTDLFFRNIDGTAKIINNNNLVGKTIETEVHLLSTFKSGRTIIQKFLCDLKVEGKKIYEGTADFGFFPKSSLTNQLGLDNGVDNEPRQNFSSCNTSESGYSSLDNLIDNEPSKNSLFFKNTKKVNNSYKINDKLNLLDEIFISFHSGKFNKGYIYAIKNINPNLWFFPCHFYNDPVMPGSLGLEAILQSIKIFAIETFQLKNPKFNHLNLKTTWKYRGQIDIETKSMSLEVHIKEIKKSKEAIEIIADSSIWKDKIRIYEILDIGIKISEK